MDVQNRILSYLLDDAIRKLSRSHRRADAFISLRDTLRKHPPSTVTAWHGMFRTCHGLYGELGGTLTSDHWQAPAFAAVGVDEAGDEAASIVANFNDYKRDQHGVGLAWEQAYAKEFLSGAFFRAPAAHMTTSGMAALMVAALVVRKRLPAEYRIAVGMHSYFENKELLSTVFPEHRITYFDEASPTSLSDIRPNAVFFDSLANDPSMTVADTSGILSVAGTFGHHTDVVIDTTCVSVAHVRIPLRTKLSGRVSVIGFESLNKFHQFGLDRVTGGIVWAMGIPAYTIYRMRDHAGVNIAEASAAAIPAPNASLHAAYLRRIESNALNLARALEDVPNIRVVYPGLPSHRNYRLARASGYAGAFVSVEFPGSDWRRYRKALQRILSHAELAGLPIVAGTTFGTPVTRVYTWSPQSIFERPFLRVAPGLETPEEFSGISRLITGVLLGVS